MQLSSITAVEEWIIQRVVETSGISARDVHRNRAFAQLGLDSVSVTQLVEALSERLGRKLSATLPFACPTVAELARAALSDAPSLRPDQRRGPDPQELAVVGMGCRFPGASGLRPFWQLLRAGRAAIIEVPEERWSAAAVYDPEPGVAGKSVSRWGGFIEGEDQFEPQFFGISSREAVEMDPQQRLALEVSWEALEDAGIVPGALRDLRVGVFAGAMWNEYALMSAGDLTGYRQHSATGNDTSIIAARISYFLGVRGPSLTVNTACSSSLVALHLAAQSLRDGDSDLALVVGVNLMLTPDAMVAMSKFGGLSPSGRCHAFDARADGYVRSEGCGVVVLRRLQDALRAGNRVDALVLGSAVNNDGASNGLTAPNPVAQEEVLGAACVRARVDPARVQYVEAHGTGTLLGDPIEARAIGAVYGQAPGRSAPVRLGSVKTNIGHLESAAGVAGVIKTVLAMRHRELPPSLNFEQPNPHIPFEELNLHVQKQLEPWEGGSELLAAVSAFGFGGTNCHVLLGSFEDSPQRLVPVAARSLERVRLLASDALEAIEREPDSIEALRAGRLAAEPLPALRAVLPASNRRELVDALEALQTSRRSSPRLVIGRTDRPRAPVFVYCGQGAQWPGMARGMLTGNRAFRGALERCAESFDRRRTCSLLQLMAQRDASWHQQPELLWPAMVALGVALTEHWRELGVGPAAVVGHSIGEIAAAYACGALSIEDAMEVAMVQGEAIAGASGRGSMLFVALPWERACELSAASSGRVHAVVHAAPEQSVLAGDPRALASIARELQATGVYGQSVQTTVAAHSPALAPLAASIRASLGDLRPAPSRIPFVSSVTGEVLDGSELGAAYWARHFCSQVRFESAIRTAATSFDRLFVEVGPHPILRRAIEESLRFMKVEGRAEATLRRGCSASSTIQEALGALYLAGVDVQWPDLGSASFAPLLPLSARTSASLAACARQMMQALQDVRDLGEPGAVRDLCVTAGQHRTHFEERVVVRAADEAELSQLLAQLALDPQLRHPKITRGRAASSPGVAFVFSGQGSQWPEMWSTLRDEPAARVVLERCEAAYRACAGESLHEIVQAPAEGSRLDLTEYAQPAIVATQLALVAWWRQLGVQPAVVIGHSIGEVSAASVAGCFGMEHAIELAWRRASAMRSAPAGKMLAVEASAEQVAGVLGELWLELDVAALNGPTSIVLSGAPACMEEARGRLATTGWTLRSVNERYAFHGRTLAAAARTLQAVLADHAARAPSIPMISSVLGARVGEIDGRYWARNVRESVRFADAVAGALREGSALFLEIGPRPVLGRDIRATAEGQGRTVVCLASMRRSVPARTALVSSACELYVGGVDVAWGELVPHGRHGRVAPTYGWVRSRYWRSGVTKALSEADTRAPRGEVDVQIEPFLTDHVVGDAPVAPAAWYVELASRIAESAEWTLQRVALKAMLPLADGEERSVRVRQERGAHGLQLSVLSESAGAEPTLHATLTLGGPTRAWENGQGLDQALRSCPRRLGPQEHYALMRRRGLHYGPAFQAVAELWLGDRMAVARLVLPETVCGATTRCHPSVLDAALQTFMALTAEDGQLRVPVYAESVAARGALPPRGWAIASVADDGTGAVTILDEQETPRASVAGLKVAPVGERARSPLAGLLYQRSWVDATGSAVAAREPRSYGLVLDRGGFGEKLATALRRHGQRVVEIEPGGEPGARADRPRVDLMDATSWRTLLRSCGEGSLGVLVDLTALDPMPSDEVWSAIEAPAAGSASALLATQAMLRSGWRDMPRLVWVTSHLDTHATDPRSATQAAVWGFARTLSVEHPEIEAKCIDLDSSAMDAVEGLVQELQRTDDEDQVLLRGQVRRVARLTHGPVMSERSGRVRSDGTYLITGGLGALGLVAAEWLAGAGAGHVVLVGRTSVNEDSAAALERIRSRGVSLSVMQVDVADRESMRRLFDVLRQGTRPPLRGLIHAAGVLDDGTILEQSAARFERVMRPKVQGAWNLHALSSGLPLDFFVMFSSVASLIGLPGQANYAAANGFLDALASFRREQGLAGVSLQWGPFAKVGMAAASERRGGRLQPRGLRGLDPALLGSVLGSLDEHTPAQLSVMELDVRQWGEFYPHVTSSPYWSGLRSQQAQTNPQDGLAVRQLRRLGPARARQELRQLLMNEFALVLQMSAEELDWTRSFGNLGMDSLMSLEVRNRLETHLGCKLAPTLLFTYPTLDQLLEHALTYLASDDAAAPTASSSAEERGAVAALELASAELASLSEEDAQLLLSRTLASLQESEP